MRTHLSSIAVLLTFCGQLLAADAPEDSTMVLEGGAEGTTFKSLTIEAENRVEVEFERPRLSIDLDAASAPGLRWGSPHDVLNRSLPNFLQPFVAHGRSSESPYLSQPWLNTFRSDDLVRLQPQLEGVERWALEIADSKGRVVRTFKGKGSPPEVLGWNGADDSGKPCMPGLTYSFVLNAYDRAGNERNFVGDSFELPPYRVGDSNSPKLLFAATVIQSSTTGGDALSAEIASVLNQAQDPTRPVHLKVHARSQSQAENIARMLSDRLNPRLIGPGERILFEAAIDDAAPRAGSVELSLAASK